MQHYDAWVKDISRSTGFEDYVINTRTKPAIRFSYSFD
jgi:hypothetical protein